VLEYVHPTRRGVRLLPANPDFAPLEADGERTEIRIAGPVVAVWRMVKGGR
jgi:SOS-response transcriptional repressor LexA